MTSNDHTVSIEIYMQDLTPEKQEEIRKARGYDDASNDWLVPIAILDIDTEEIE